MVNSLIAKRHSGPWFSLYCIFFACNVAHLRFSGHRWRPGCFLSQSPLLGARRWASGRGYRRILGWEKADPLLETIMRLATGCSSSPRRRQARCGRAHEGGTRCRNAWVFGCGLLVFKVSHVIEAWRAVWRGHENWNLKCGELQCTRALRQV